MIWTIDGCLTDANKRQSATIVLIMQDNRILICQGEGYDLNAPSQYWEIIENTQSFSTHLNDINHEKG